MIKTLPIDEQPREKLIANGCESLSNTELLAIILRTGTNKKSALQLAQEVFMICESDISELKDLSIEALCKIDGIGMSKACQLHASIEFGKRINHRKLAYGQKISSPLDVIETFRDVLTHEKTEKFIVAFLTTKNEIIGWEIISHGSLNASIVHPREVYHKAIRKSAAAIIAVHNHPSGYIEPSREDINITKRLHESGVLIGIPMLDHIIIGARGYYSFKEHQAF